MATEGDIVTVHWKCFSEEGEVGVPVTPALTDRGCLPPGWSQRCIAVTLPPVSRSVQLLESSEQAEEPTTFEVGAGDIVGNRLFEVLPHL